MRFAIRLSAILIAVASLPVPAAPVAAQEQDAGLREIRAIFDRWQQSWDAHDMRAFAALFHEDGVWIVWTGRLWQGRATIEAGHVEAHRTFFRNARQILRVDEIQRVAPDVAVVRLYSTLTGDSRHPNETVRARKLVVVTRRDGVWRIAFGQNTRLADGVPE